MFDALSEHPRRALLLFLALFTVAVGGPAVLTYVTEHQRSRGDEATLLVGPGGGITLSGGQSNTKVWYWPSN